MTGECPVSVDPFGKEVAYSCTCGWRGTESDVSTWFVDEDRNRVLRVCPGCETPRPEWGALGPIDAVARIAKSDLQTQLANAGVLND